MKLSKCFLSVFVLSLFACQSAFGVLMRVTHGEATGVRAFKRTYLNSLHKEGKYSFSTRKSPQKALNMPMANARTSSNEVPVFISSQDFTSHLNVGNVRLFQGIEPTASSPINMDIGIIDWEGATAQNWYLPDFSTFPIFDSLNANHIRVNDVASSSDFPLATHAITTDDGSQAEFYELTEFDLFFLGYTENIGMAEETSFDYDQTLTPVPLDFNFGLQTTVLIEFDGDPELDSLKYEQYYDVVGFGTLHTFDDGSHDALKMIFTEEEYVYKDGELIDYYEYHEIVWYSKQGHHVRAGIDDPWNSEGQQNLLYMDYQRLTTEVPLEPTEFTASAQSASQILLNWKDNAVNETGYEIQRSKFTAENEDGSFGIPDATFTAPANAEQFTDNTADAGTEYHYKVRAVKN